MNEAIIKRFQEKVKEIARTDRIGITGLEEIDPNNEIEGDAILAIIDWAVKTTFDYAEDLLRLGEV